MRQALRILLEREPQFSGVAEAGSGLEVANLIDKHQPDIVIMDLMMPGLNGLETLRQITRRYENVQSIVLSMHADESYVVQAIANGACAYVLKDSTALDLIQAVYTVMKGGHYLSPSLSQHAVELYFRHAQEGTSSPYEELTTREREVLQLVAEGNTSTKIAELLSISRRTVEGYRASMLRKLNLRTQADVVRYAVRQGIIASDTTEVL